MKTWSLALLRVSIGFLILIWGLDKLVNPTHAVGVAEHFYLGVLAAVGWQRTLGSFETVLGVLIVLGLFRRWTYPVLAAVTGVTLLAVWRSILDPWGWYLANTNALFFPSLTVFAGVLVLIGFRDEDRLVVRSDAPRARDPGPRDQPTD